MTTTPLLAVVRKTTACPVTGCVGLEARACDRADDLAVFAHHFPQLGIEQLDGFGGGATQAALSASSASSASSAMPWRARGPGQGQRQRRRRLGVTADELERAFSRLAELELGVEERRVDRVDARTFLLELNPNADRRPAPVLRSSRAPARLLSTSSISAALGGFGAGRFGLGLDRGLRVWRPTASAPALALRRRLPADRPAWAWHRWRRQWPAASWGAGANPSTARYTLRRSSTERRSRRTVQASSLDS